MEEVMTIDERKKNRHIWVGAFDKTESFILYKVW